MSTVQPSTPAPAPAPALVPAPAPAKNTTQVRRYYGVRVGRSVHQCIFLNRNDAKAQTDGFVGAEWREFDDLIVAGAWVASAAAGTAAASVTAASAGTAASTAAAASSTAAAGTASAASAAASSAQKRPAPAAAPHQSTAKKQKTASGKTGSSASSSSKKKTKKKTKSSSKAAAPEKQKRKRKIHKAWEARFDELKAYKDRNGGSLDVSGDTAEEYKLRQWSGTQRTHYRSYREGKDISRMTEDKVRMLEGIGFDFEYSEAAAAARSEGGGDGDGQEQDGDDDATKGQGQRRPYKAWEAMFAKLKEYKDGPSGSVGSCEIDKKDEAHSALRSWCNEQQLQYSAMKSGKKTSMSDEKVRRLTELGLEFKHHTWEERMEQLRKFKEETGGMNVPIDHATMGKWARKVRSQYRQFAEGGSKSNGEAESKSSRSRSTGLTREQFDELTSMGFRPTGRKSIIDNEKEGAKWDAMFAELVKYKEEKGDCLVSTTPPQNDLTRWVLAQRREYQKLKDDKDSLLTASRLAKLNDVGFVFRQKKDYASWDTRITQMRQFRETNGHVRIPVSHPTLGWFVSSQREEYRKRTTGKPSSLNDERLKDLTDLGFIFLAGKRKGTQTMPRKTWDERFDDLLDFKEEYGHSVVPQHYPGLGYWVHAQRNNYRKLRQGKPSPLTHERAMKLADVGFVFDALKRKGVVVGGGGGGGNEASDEEV